MSEYAIAVDDALARLAVIPDYDAGNGPEPCVHTFIPSAFSLLGAHWSLTDVEASMRKWGVEESGDQAKAMRHGLVVIEERDGRRMPVFFETKEGE